MINHENQPEETRPEHINVKEKMASFFLTFDEFSAYLYGYDETDLGQELLNILNDSDNEKLERMRDLRDEKINMMAQWVSDVYSIDGVAMTLWKLMAENE
jgi:hypothetical protein